MTATEDKLNAFVGKAIGDLGASVMPASGVPTPESFAVASKSHRAAIRPPPEFAVAPPRSARAPLGWSAGKTCPATPQPKAAVVQMTKPAALDYAKTNVRINAICPGMTYTGLAGAKPDDEVPPGSYLPTPMARWGEPAELAAAALFLASDEASFITGAALAVDGGYSASGPMLSAGRRADYRDKP
jgi:NAD(P)-dependent dehydrogenase (short-subunit alcohol dehydrogenase family)